MTYYESQEALRNLTNWYTHQKEHSFIEFIFDDLQFPSVGLVVEIGGGAGIHGHILADRFGDRYLFTDLSKTLVNAAAASGLRAVQMDGLSLTFERESVACAFLVGTSTLLLDKAPRHRQFLECSRIIKPDGIGVFVTSRRDRRYHTFDKDDLDYLRDLGFSTIRSSWGVIPGALWKSKNRNIFSAIEKWASKVNLLTYRDIILARRA